MVDAEALQELAAWFEREGWPGEVWTREAVAKQLRVLAVKWREPQQIGAPARFGVDDVRWQIVQPGVAIQRHPAVAS